MLEQKASKTWKIRKPDEKIVSLLVKKAGITDIIARILVNRGISNEKDAAAFFNPALKNLIPPDDLPDIYLAVERILKAIRDKEKIIVYGDYDADGITSTALLLSFFNSIGADAAPYQPHRIEEGYGLHKGAIGKFAKDGIRLIVAVDLGISDAEAVDYATEKAIDVIVVDHHQLPDKIPSALAVIAPLRTKKAAPFVPLSGVGLAFYLASAVRAALKSDPFFKDTARPDMKEYLDLVALGTVADMMSLTGLNRILVTHGLKTLSSEKRAGVAALKDEARLNRKRVTAEQVAFQLGPRLNAAGRMADASVAVELLTTEDSKMAGILAQKLEKFNQKRQYVEKDILEQALQIVEMEKLDEKPAIVLANDGWNPGVLGIVASRLVDRYSVPAIVISFDGDNGKGSVRSVPGINAWKALDLCRDHLVGFGGHEMAGGVMVKREKVDDFRAGFCKAISDVAADREPRMLDIDMEIDIDDIDVFFLRQINTLEPFGIGNPEPLFYATGVNCSSVKKVGNNHLKFRVKSSNGAIEAIAFKLGERETMLSSPVDIAFTPSLSSWNGIERVELKVKDIRPTA